jgi:GntR family transcriptional regulator, transcriptional repressor for pyruvate dehydrogenase complex
VLDLIREQDLAPGARLPSAKALAEQFAVATPTMREALRRLQATGVIDIRHGSGIYVRQREQRLVLPNPGYGDLESHTILQVLDARLLVEPHLAELAAVNTNDELVVELERILTNAEEILSNGDNAYLDANNRFHSTVARASGNLVLAQIIESLIELYSSELHLVDPTQSLVEGRAKDHQVHQQIFQAVTNGDAAKARDAMFHHIQTAQTTVAARLTG